MNRLDLPNQSTIESRRVADLPKINSSASDFSFQYQSNYPFSRAPGPHLTTSCAEEFAEGIARKRCFHLHILYSFKCAHGSAPSRSTPQPTNL